MIKAEIQNKDLIKHLQSISPDKMTMFTMAEGRIRGALFNGSTFVNQMRAQHNLGILETMILGQASLCGALTIPMMKDMEHTVIKYEGDGPVQGFSVEVNSTGYVRSYLYNEHIPVTKPLQNWDLTEFLGKGTLSFSRIHKDDKYPQTSTVEIQSGNIAQNFAWYFQQSEQINTAFNSSVQFDKKGNVIGAGAMFLQVIPDLGGNGRLGEQLEDSHSDKDADDKLMKKVEIAFQTAPSLGQWFSENCTDRDLIYGLFREFKPSVTLQRDIIFDCKCSKEGFIKYLRTLPATELSDIRKNGPDPLEIVCRHCGSVYHIPVSEI